MVLFRITVKYKLQFLRAEVVFFGIPYRLTKSCQWFTVSVYEERVVIFTDLRHPLGLG